MSENKLNFITGFILFLVVGGSIFINVMIDLNKEKPTTIERIWGIVERVNGNYTNSKDPKDVCLIADFKGIKVTEMYRAEYNNWEPEDPEEYDKCWKSLLLKPGDKISAIRKRWADGSVSYELDP